MFPLVALEGGEAAAAGKILNWERGRTLAVGAMIGAEESREVLDAIVTGCGRSEVCGVEFLCAGESWSLAGLSRVVKSSFDVAMSVFRVASIALQC